ncbi:hypothetical protein P4S72_07760 [Vibrio sp. PP-XX7]
MKLTPDFEVIFAGLSAAFAQVMCRHDVLNTNYVLENGELHLRRNPHSERSVLERQRITPDVDIAVFKHRELNYLFDLEHDCPIRAHLIEPLCIG